MGPASGDSQVFPFVFNHVVDPVAVRDAYPAEILQELPGVAGISRPLVLVKDNLALRVHPSGAVHPHVAFAPGGAAVLVHQHGGLVRLQDMVPVHFFVQAVIKNREVTVRALDRPVRHVLPGNVQAVPFELTLLAVKRHRVDVFRVEDALVNKNWTFKLYFFTYNLPLLYSRICFPVLPGCKISQRICRPFFVKKFYICGHFFLNIFSLQVKISK